VCWWNSKGYTIKAQEFYDIHKAGKSVADVNKESAFLQDSMNGCEQTKSPVSIE